MGHGVEVEDGELTGTPDTNDGPLVSNTQHGSFQLGPGVNATDFA